jgi:hypothetical protein
MSKDTKISLEDWLAKNNKDINSLSKKDWDYVSEQCELTKEQIRQFKYKLNWNIISYHQNLDEDSIIEHADYINWFWISAKQKLSSEFIKKFKNKLYWFYICRYQKLTEEFFKEFHEEILPDYRATCFYSEKTQSKLKYSWQYKKI